MKTSTDILLLIVFIGIVYKVSKHIASINKKKNPLKVVPKERLPIGYIEPVKNKNKPVAIEHDRNGIPYINRKNSSTVKGTYSRKKRWHYFLTNKNQ